MNATGALTAAGIAAIAAVVALYLYRRKVWPKTVVILALFASLGIAGGVFGRFLDWVGGQMAKTTNNATATFFGIGVPLVVAAVMALALFFALKPKGPGPTKWSPLVALFFVPVCLAVGGVAANVGGAMQDGYAALVPAASSAFSDAVASFRR